MKGSGSISSHKRKADDAKSYASAAATFQQNQLEEIGFDPEQLEEYKTELEEEIRNSVGEKRENNLQLHGKVTERLSVLQRFPALANADKNPAVVTMATENEVKTSDKDDENKDMDDGGDDDDNEDDKDEEMDDSGHKDEEEEEEEKSDDGSDKDEKEEEADESDDDGDEEEEKVEEEEEEEKDPIKRQIKRAMRQLAALQAAQRQRLVKAKHWLDSGTVASTEDISTKLDEAIALIDLHTDKSLLLESAFKVIVEEQDLVLPLTDIQTLIDEIHQCLEVKKALDKGIVKPFFHTLLLPETFLNNRRTWTKVTPGEVNEGREVRLDVNGKNFNDVVITVDTSGNERGACILIDKGLGGEWEFDVDQTAFAVNLVNADAEMLGEDIECTKLTSPPVKIDPGVASSELLTRAESRGVVADTFDRFAISDGIAVTAITGSPGIGKSWTLLYALQQALLYDGANVLFFFQKTSFAVMYIRRKNKIYAWSSACLTSAYSNLFCRTDVLVLLDPKEADRGGANFELGEMKLLYAASNNKVHISSAAVKQNGKMQAYLGPPIDSEMDIMLRCIDPTLSREIIILNKSKYVERLSSTETAVRDCAADSVLLDKAMQADGMSTGIQTIPGTLFQVLPKRPKNPASVGYDGQNVMYRKRVSW